MTNPTEYAPERRVDERGVVFYLPHAPSVLDAVWPGFTDPATMPANPERADALRREIDRAWERAVDTSYDLVRVAHEVATELIRTGRTRVSMTGGGFVPGYQATELTARVTDLHRLVMLYGKRGA